MLYKGDYATYEGVKPAISTMDNAESCRLNKFLPAFSDFHLQMEWTQVRFLWNATRVLLHVDMIRGSSTRQQGFSSSAAEEIPTVTREPAPIGLADAGTIHLRYCSHMTFINFNKLTIFNYTIIQLYTRISWRSHRIIQISWCGQLLGLCCRRFSFDTCYATPMRFSLYHVSVTSYWD